MTVSATRMNVLYAGLANPISISVPGMASRDISATMTNGRIEQSAGGFMAYPEKVGTDAEITVNVTVDKVIKKMGTMKYRVKKVPNPTASVAGKTMGMITKNELLAEQGVYAEIPDFDFDMKFQVLSFVVSTPTKDGFTNDRPVNGNRFSQEQRDMFSKLARGNRVNIDNIVVKGEDGFTRTLPSISFKIN
jgi:gliding motility-associated protein GldM